MSTTRVVKYVGKDFGLWSMTCAECPLLQHTEALGQDAPSCASGLTTSMQGPIAFKTCRHLSRDSYRNNADGDITIVCNHGAAK